MISGYQPAHADNQRAGNTLSHIQTVGYRWKYKSKYVINGFILKGEKTSGDPEVVYSSDSFAAQLLQHGSDPNAVEPESGTFIRHCDLHHNIVKRTPNIALHVISKIM